MLHDARHPDVKLCSLRPLIAHLIWSALVLMFPTLVSVSQLCCEPHQSIGTLWCRTPASLHDCLRSQRARYPSSSSHHCWLSGRSYQLLRIELCRTSRINLFVTFPNLKTSKTPERAYNFNSLEMTKWQSTPKMLSRVSPMHLLLVSNCAWMFQDHSFKKALENGGVAFPDCVSPKAIPRFADVIYISWTLRSSLVIYCVRFLQVVAYHMARARIFNKTGACVFLETEVDSNRVRMKCTMSNISIWSLSLSPINPPCCWTGLGWAGLGLGMKHEPLITNELMNSNDYPMLRKNTLIFIKWIVQTNVLCFYKTFIHFPYKLL